MVSGAVNPSGWSRTGDAPPQRTGRLGAWLMLALCLVLACPGLLVELHKPDVINTDEAYLLATTVQTDDHHRDHIVSDQSVIDRVLPYLHGQPQWREPPLVTWLLLGVLDVVSDEPVSVQHLILTARLVTAMMALLAIAGVYWAGLSIGEARTGLYAALICAAHPMLIDHARSATPSIYGLGWGSISVAFALWAIRPLRPKPSLIRQAIGWTACGVAVGAAVMTLGLWALPQIGLSILVMLMLCPDRVSHLLGWVAALVISILMVLPWAIYVQGRDDGAWIFWLGQLTGVVVDYRTQPMGEIGWRLAAILGMTLPWTFWLVGAFAQPFSSSTEGNRTRLFLGWSWFIWMVIIVFTTPRELLSSSINLLIPAFSVLLGQVLGRYTDLAAEGRFVRLWRWLRWPHVVLLAVASVAVPAALHGQQHLIDQGWLGSPLVSQPGWVFWLGTSAMLLTLTVVGARWALTQYPGRALVAWALWSLMAMTMINIPWARSPRMINPVQDEAHRVLQLIGEQPIYAVEPSKHKVTDRHADLWLYLRRPVPHVLPEQIDKILEGQDEVYFLVSTGEMASSKPGRRVHQLKHAGLDLFVQSAKE